MKIEGGQGDGASDPAIPSLITVPWRSLTAITHRVHWPIRIFVPLPTSRHTQGMLNNATGVTDCTQQSTCGERGMGGAGQNLARPRTEHRERSDGWVIVFWGAIKLYEYLFCRAIFIQLHQWYSPSYVFFFPWWLQMAGKSLIMNARMFAWWEPWHYVVNQQNTRPGGRWIWREIHNNQTAG